MINNPSISVIMPVYNAQEYLYEAIQSILTQTYSNFELIIINDGSVDKSEEIIKSFSDSRIKYLKNKKNLGLSPTLNVGLKHATGNYIARMDADDLSHRLRFAKQVEFLDKHKDYGVVGCLYVVLDEHRVPYEIGGMGFENDQEIKLSLFSNNVFLHGETMIRSSIIKENNFLYNFRYNPCEDYDLWVRMSQVTKFAILKDVLYSYMINPNSMSGTRWLEMKNMIRRIGRELQSKKGLPNVDRKFLLMLLRHGRKKRDSKIKYDNQLIKQYDQLNYQEFIFRTGLVYLKKINLRGIDLLTVSFLINPLNWFLKFYRLIFVKHPRLKKKSQ